MVLALGVPAGHPDLGGGISSPRSAALGANQSRHSPAAPRSPFFQLPLPWRNPTARRRSLLENMDFAIRHTAAAPPATAGADASSFAVTEEPEYLARYFVVKHSWRGRYRRILCIAASGVVTLDPTTLAVTNSYDFAADFDRAAPEPNAATEFSLSVRTDGKGKFKAMRLSSPLRAGILTELHRLRPVHPVIEFPVLHLRRHSQECAPFGDSVLNMQGFGLCTAAPRRWV